MDAEQTEQPQDGLRLVYQELAREGDADYAYLGTVHPLSDVILRQPGTLLGVYVSPGTGVYTVDLHDSDRASDATERNQIGRIDANAYPEGWIGHKVHLRRGLVVVRSNAAARTTILYRAGVQG
jgi:hypothetical protein